jgi:secondary thiamine-phosphate synthase enzyme
MPALTSSFLFHELVSGMTTFRIRTSKRTQFLDITREVEHAVRDSGVADGLCYVYVPHTTAGVTINEHADPDVARDVEGIFDRLVPHEGPYRHAEGNTDSHMKAILTGASQTVFVENGKLALGAWQGIFLCEFDGPRQRTVFVKVMGDRS